MPGHARDDVVGVTEKSRPVRTQVVCIFVHMPRMQVYLPDELYREVKERGLAASELLQKAIAVEVRRLELEAQADDYLAELVAEVGEPSEVDLTRAEELLGEADGSPSVTKAS